MNQLTKRRIPLVLLTHPFEIGLATVFTILGAGLILSGHQVRTVGELPEIIVIAWELGLLVGGPLIIWGITRPGIEGYALERAGLYLATSTWATYALTVAYIAPGAFLSIAQSATLATACFLRAMALHRVEKETREAVLKQNGRERPQ